MKNEKEKEVRQVRKKSKKNHDTVTELASLT